MFNNEPSIVIMKKKDEEENKIPVYTVTENDIYKISLVDEPAIESQMVYFKKDKPLFVSFEVDGDKHMVYSAVLRPDFPIYRRYGEEEFYLVFTREAVEKSAYDFLKNGFQHEWSVDHEEDVEGLSIVESWIKTDMDNDKSISLGLDPTLEIGTWFVGLSVNNIEVWKRIKEGDFGGLSMEAFVYIDENKFSKINNKDMKKKNSKFETVEIDESFWQRLKDIIADALKTPELTPEVADEEADEVVEDVKEEVEVVEMEEAETVAEEAAEDVKDAIEEAAEDVEEEKDALETVVDELNARIDELNAEIENLKKENQKLKKQPSTKEIKANAQPKGSSRDTIERLYNGTYFKK